VVLCNGGQQVVAAAAPALIKLVREGRQVKGSLIAAVWVAVLSIEVDSKVPVVAAAAPALIKIVQEGRQVRSLVAASLAGSIS
jgi:hypothetical protein